MLKRFMDGRGRRDTSISRLSYMSALGMMTRVNSQFEKTHTHHDYKLVNGEYSPGRLLDL